jgi:exosortase A-associated hydrolase 1
MAASGGDRVNEETFVFDCEGERLVGVLHRGAERAPRGVLVVVGGPQYRVGSHRQFVRLARDLAQAGVPALRFDYRGMGDADGVHPGFERAGPDIAAAMSAFCARVPSLREVVIWGLCDAASAALLYAHADARVTGIVLANPWVRTDATEAQTYLRHYYLGRLRSASFWRSLAQGGVRPLESLRSLWSHALAALRGARDVTSLPFPERMLDGLARFRGRVLLILSGNDLTAAEFCDRVRATPRWRALLGRETVTRRELAGATHTFSSHEWRAQVSAWTTEWLATW